MSKVLENKLVQIEQECNNIFTIYVIGRCRHTGKWTYKYLHTVEDFYTLEDSVQFLAKHFAMFVCNNNHNGLFTQQELQEEYFEQIINNDCDTLYDFLETCTNYFQGYKKLIVSEKNTVTELKEFAKMCYIKNISKYKKYELIKIINNKSRAIKI